MKLYSRWEASNDFAFTAGNSETPERAGKQKSGG
jgi:hypothetical protein